MCVAEIALNRRVAAALIVLVTLAGGCNSEDSATKPASTQAAANKPSPTPGAKAKAKAEADAKAKAKREADLERADKLADLNDMCGALNHDYDDGTLTDYYRDVKPRTEWGKAQREAGNKAMQPGRLLEKAVAELSPGARGPALEHCRKLLDYIDEVE